MCLRGFFLSVQNPTLLYIYSMEVKKWIAAVTDWVTRFLATPVIDKAIPVLTLLILLDPIQQCYALWFSGVSNQGIAIVALVGAAVIWLQNRQSASLIEADIKSILPDPMAKSRRGTLWPIIVNIGFLVFSVLASSPTVSFITILTTLAAISLWRRSYFVAIAFRSTFIFASLATPLPQGIYRSWIEYSSGLTSIFVGHVATTLGIKNTVTASGIVMNDNMFILPIQSGLSPHTPLWLTLLIGGCWLVYMKKTRKECILWGGMALLITLVLHCLRLDLILVAARISVDAGYMLLLAPNWIVSIFSLGLTAMIRRLWRIRTDRVNRFIVEGLPTKWN